MENLDQRLATVPAVKQQLIDASLFSPLGKRKATQLINNSEQSFNYHLKEDECLLMLKQPLFISSIRIYGENVQTKLKLRVNELTDNKNFAESTNVENEYIEFSINRFVKELALVPVRGIFKVSSVKLTKLEVDGFELNQIHNIAESIKQYITLKDDILDELEKKQREVNDNEAKLNAERKKFADSISSLNDEITSKKTKTVKLQEQLDNIKKEYDIQFSASEKIDQELKTKEQQLTELKGKEELFHSKNKTIEDAIEQNNRKNSSLNVEIADNEKRLQDLIANKNLFSEELSTYNEASEYDMKYHTRWAVGSGVLLGIISFTCFIFLSILAFRGDGSWEKILLTRLPLSIFTIFLIKGLYSFMRNRLDKVTELKEKRKNLIAIGIIAKEITEPIASEFELSDDQKIKLKFNEKIEMMKSLLLSVTGSNTEYKSHKLKSLLAYIKTKKPESKDLILTQKNNEQIKSELTH